MSYTVLIVREKHKDSAGQLFYMKGTQQQTRKKQKLIKSCMFIFVSYFVLNIKTYKMQIISD